MRWYLNPFAIRRAASDVRSVASGGGPAELHLKGISHPKGWIFPYAEVTLDVVGKDGKTTTFTPELPVMFPLAWCYRLARILKVPLIKDVDPGKISARLDLPWRRGSS